MVRSNVRKPRTALRCGPTRGLAGRATFAAGEDIEGDLDRGRAVVAGRGRGVELEVEPDVEQPGDVLGPLEVAAHPEEVLGDPAEHFSRPRGVGVGRLGRGRPGWSVVQHPGILGSAPLRAVDDQAPFRQRDPRQAARHDHDVFAVEHERPQVDVPAVEPAVARRSGAGEGEIVGWAM